MPPAEGFATYDPNTHFLQPKIAGYRQLNHEEVAHINNVKALGAEVGALLKALEGGVMADPRWLAVARTQLQQGFMALTRSIAQPEGF
jgi:hypothetical protein